MAGDVWESSVTSTVHCCLWNYSSSDRTGFTRLLFMHSTRHWQKNCCACGLWSLSPISSSQCPAASPSQILPHLSHLNVFFWTVSAPAVDTFGFPSLIHQHQSFLHVLHSPLLFFGGSACWAEREERILCYQSSEKGCGANWWWRGMYHGGKEGPRSCLGKSISHTSLLHLSDKGKKNSNGDSNKTDWAFYRMLMPAVKWQ